MTKLEDLKSKYLFFNLVQVTEQNASVSTKIYTVASSAAESERLIKEKFKTFNVETTILTQRVLAHTYRDSEFIESLLIE